MIGIFNCSFCQKSCKNDNSLRNHRRLCAANPQRQISSVERYNKTRDKVVPWNKGLTKSTDERVLKHADMLKGKPFKGKHSEEALKRLSTNAKLRGLGGYRPHPNKGQYYKDIWFDSKWEVKVAESLDQAGVNWIRPKTGFVWSEDGKKYYPDFYLVDYDVYLDPKNDYLRIKDAEKVDKASSINNIRVIVLDGSQLLWEEIKKLL